MRITFVLPNWSTKPIGGYKVVYEYANHLVKRGHKVCVVHPLLLYPQEVDLKQKIKFYLRYMKYLVLKIKKLKWFRISHEVGMLIVPNLKEVYIPNGDVIVATAWQTAEWAAEYSTHKGRKLYFVMDFYPWLGPQDRLEATWRAPFKKIAISSWLYEKVLHATKEKNNVIAIPLGIDHTRFSVTEDLNLRPNRICMMYSTVSYKASEDGIRALEICRTQHPNLEVVLFGLTASIKAIPSWMVYRKNVSEEDLVQVYNQSKIYLCSSLAEGFAFPPAEAMACGCAVVSTDCGGIHEYAEHKVNVLLSPPKDPQALAQNILHLLENDDLRVKLARAGHQRIQKFTWNKAVVKLEEVLNKK
jgi:glycosyltransferase involved in cell wall biosynthesis